MSRAICCRAGGSGGLSSSVTGRRPERLVLSGFTGLHPRSGGASSRAASRAWAHREDEAVRGSARWGIVRVEAQLPLPEARTRTGAIRPIGVVPGWPEFACLLQRPSIARVRIVFTQRVSSEGVGHFRSFMRRARSATSVCDEGRPACLMRGARVPFPPSRRGSIHGIAARPARRDPSWEEAADDPPDGPAAGAVAEEEAEEAAPRGSSATVPRCASRPEPVR